MHPRFRSGINVPIFILDSLAHNLYRACSQEIVTALYNTPSSKVLSGLMVFSHGEDIEALESSVHDVLLHPGAFQYR